MSNTAEIYKFPAPIPTQQECRMADLENGYLRLANQIQDALCIVELSGREFRVLNAIIRLTYGWSKKSDRIANSLIADKTTLKVKHVSEAVLSLAYRNIIILRRIGQTFGCSFPVTGCDCLLWCGCGYPCATRYSLPPAQ